MINPERSGILASLVKYVKGKVWKLVYYYAFCKYVHIAQTLLYTIALHVSLDICLQTVLLPPSRSISHLWLCTVTKKEGRLIHLDGGSTTITYVRANARFNITMRFL